MHRFRIWLCVVQSKIYCMGKIDAYIYIYIYDKFKVILLLTMNITHNPHLIEHTVPYISCNYFEINIDNTYRICALCYKCSNVDTSVAP